MRSASAMKQSVRGSQISAAKAFSSCYRSHLIRLLTAQVCFCLLLSDKGSAWGRHKCGLHKKRAFDLPLTSRLASHPSELAFDSNVISVLTRSDQKVNQIGDVLHVCHSTLQSLQVIGNLFDNVEMTFSCFASNPIYSVSVDALYSRIKCIKTLWIGKMLLHQLDH